MSPTVNITATENDSSADRFTRRGIRFRASISALRLHQWSKNTLIFMPLILSHQVQWWRLAAAFQAFFAFSLCASAFYVLNDLLDIEADRLHPYKTKRPFASGELAIHQGLVLFVACLLPPIVLTWMLSPGARVVLGLYAVTNLSYSVWLKRVAFLDVLVLGLLYTFRLLFGGEAENIVLSMWTLAFSGFLFLGLAFVKRWTELLSAASFNRMRLARRGYLLSHLSAVSVLAQWSLIVSVIILAFYINSLTAIQLYSHPHTLWAACFLLLAWVRRVVMTTKRGLMTDDPLLFAFKDPGSWIIAGAITVSGVMAATF